MSHRQPHPEAHESDGESSPSAGQPVIGRKGVNIPWSWIVSLLPTGGLLGAIGHASLFGAPPEFAKRLDAHQQSIAELHEDQALTKAALSRMAEDLKYIRDHLPR